MTTADSVDFVNYLASQAAARNLSIGLKNAAAIIPEVISPMAWSVNEQCVAYNECDKYRAFIDAGKPVFHIEYPSSAPNIASSTKSQICGDSSAAGFSTVLKKMNLDSFVEYCT